MTYKQLQTFLEILKIGTGSKADISNPCFLKEAENFRKHLNQGFDMKFEEIIFLCQPDLYFFQFYKPILLCKHLIDYKYFETAQEQFAKYQTTLS